MAGAKPIKNNQRHPPAPPTLMFNIPLNKQPKLNELCIKHNAQILPLPFQASERRTPPRLISPPIPHPTSNRKNASCSQFWLAAQSADAIAYNTIELVIAMRRP